MATPEGFVKTHIPCEHCGSSDGAASNADGSTKCFSCGKFTPANKEAKLEIVANTIKNLESERAAVSPINSRNISQATALHYGVKSVKSESGAELNHFYPYPNLKDPSTVSYKIRGVADKTFSWRGSPSGSGLFGQNAFRTGGKYLTITEGELDALKVYQFLGSKWPVVSLKNGASAAAKDIKENLEYVESFDNIVLCFDNDKPGQEATEAVVSLLTPGKAKVFNWGNSTLKDACDFTDPKDFTNRWWDAKVYTPSGILSASKAKEDYIYAPPREGIMTPWVGLNDKIEGFRFGEVITLTSGSGMGKSTVTKILTHWLIHQQLEGVGLMSLEESWVKTIDGVMAVHAGKRLNKQSVKSQYTKDELSVLYDEALPDDRVWIYGHYGVTDIESIFNRLRYLIVGCGCRFIMLDHLHMMVLAVKDNDERKAIDHIMGRLRSMCEETEATIVLVSHLSKLPGDISHEEGAPVSLRDLRGSQSIGQISDTILSIERNQQSEDALLRNRSKIRVVKCRETGDVGVACYLQYDPQTGLMHEVEKDTEETLEEL